MFLYRKYYELYGIRINKIDTYGGYKNILPLKLCLLTDSYIQGNKQNMLIYEYQIIDYYKHLFNNIPIIIMSEKINIGENLNDSLILENRRGISIFKRYRRNENIILIDEEYLLLTEGDDYYICLESTSDRIKQKIFHLEIENVKKYFSLRKIGKYFFINRDMRNRYPNK